MMEKEILARRQRMQELNCQAQDLVDAGHFDPNAVEETRIVMEERFVGSFFFKMMLSSLICFFEINGLFVGLSLSAWYARNPFGLEEVALFRKTI